MIIKLDDTYYRVHYNKNLGLFYITDLDFETFSDENIFGLYKKLKEHFSSVFVPFSLSQIEAINFQKFLDAIKQGYHYLINKNTGELHRLDVDKFEGSHNLSYADFNNFIFAVDIGNCKIENLPEGSPVPFYDFESGEIFTYKINKCKHCYPDK